MEENKKLKIEIRHAMIELDEARDKVINLAKVIQVEPRVARILNLLWDRLFQHGLQGHEKIFRNQAPNFG